MKFIVYNDKGLASLTVADMYGALKGVSLRLAYPSGDRYHIFVFYIAFRIEHERNTLYKKLPQKSTIEL